MPSGIVLCISVILFVHVSHGYLHPRMRELKTLEFSGDAGEPLLLTPLIRANRIQEAQDAAKVTLPGVDSPDSYSGFLTVDERYDSNLFFWFFKSRNSPSSDPVILWLQGGPGASSLFGLFVENGPFFATNSSKLELREHAWTNNHSVLYIDNPVGVGFSFAGSDRGYADNQTQVGKDLHSALVQFFRLFPELQKNDFFLAGESYAGKYVPAAAYTILKNNPGAEVRINLQGIAIGDGLSDPVSQMTQYGSFLYEIGFIDINVKRQYEQLEKNLVYQIQKEDWQSALATMDELILDDDSLFQRTAKFDNVYNYMSVDDPSTDLASNYYNFVNQEATRRAIHVGNLTYGSGEAVSRLIYDIPKSVKSWVAELLSHYRVLIYTGQLDIIVGYPLTSNYLENLEYSSSGEFKKVKRYPFYVGDELAGYSKTAGKLTDLLIRNSGHLVPFDQPVWALDMIVRFTRNKSFH